MPKRQRRFATTKVHRMSNLQTRDLSKAVITSMTEVEFAEWRKKDNARLIYHQGRYWEELRSGFYQPIHLLARLDNKQATKPKLLCWGFRSALTKNDAIAANGSIPVNLLSDVSGYDLLSLPSKRRNQVRKSRKKVKIGELTDSSLLKQQGYEVIVSALKRTAHKQAPTKDDYIAELANYFIPKRRLILGGLIGDRLGGYIEGHAIEGTAYIQNIYIASEALSTDVGSGLVFEFVQVCIRSGNIQEIVYGQHSREDTKLCRYKEGMGFPTKHIPAKVKINPVIRKLIQWRLPHSYYRLAGYNPHIFK